MIQRIQSLFLGLIVLLGVLSSFLPVLGFSFEGIDYVMNSYKTVLVDDLAHVVMKNMGVGVMQGLILMVALGSIFMFKNRSVQMKLNKLNILLIAIQVAAIVFYSDAIKMAIAVDAGEVAVQFKFGAIIPVLSLILTYLAIRFIKKDDQLVRSADRLR